MYRLRVFYRKEGMGRFISEKNLHRNIERILRRMELPLKFTEGFSPHPKISFGSPLPVGITGVNERFDVFLVKSIDTASFLENSKDFLPEGIIFTATEWIDITAPSITSMETSAIYTIETSKDIDIEYFNNTGKVLEYTDKKIVVLFKINKLSHKKLIELLVNGNIISITREIL
ncbi:MAG: TIGR03936 family radical SAM-associated protein [bacterium]|nr:TIGR03936 family radical SAM-associated protein [bacterium]